MTKFLLQSQKLRMAPNDLCIFHYCASRIIAEGDGCSLLHQLCTNMQKIELLCQTFSILDFTLKCL
jgi:hypothetical protein